MFYTSMHHSKPFCIGLNCALGASDLDMRPYLQRLGQVAEVLRAQGQFWHRIASPGTRTSECETQRLVRARM